MPKLQLATPSFYEPSLFALLSVIGAVDAFSTIVRTEGMAALYKGLIPTLVGVGVGMVVGVVWVCVWVGVDMVVDTVRVGRIICIMVSFN